MQPGPARAVGHCARDAGRAAPHRCACQAVAPVADGRIDSGEYADGDGFAFDFATGRNPGRSYLLDETTRATKDPSDLSVRMHAAHTSKALYLSFRVRDQAVRADAVAARTPF